MFAMKTQVMPLILLPSINRRLLLLNAENNWRDTSHHLMDCGVVDNSGIVGS